MKYFPSDGDDVTEDDQSSDVGHLEKVTSRQAVEVTASAIFRMWRKRSPPHVTTARHGQQVERFY